MRAVLFFVLASAPMALSLSTSKTAYRKATPSNLIWRSSVMDKEDTQSVTKPSDDNYLSPFLQEMVDEQRELQMKVGKALDVLRKDYPYFLKRSPDFSIFDSSITIRDPSGVQLSGLSSYKNAFSVMRTMVSLLYDTDRSVIQNRMVFDSTRCQIRVSFNAMLVPKLGGRAVHVDGISVYSVDSILRDRNGARKDGGGKIVEHRIEKLLVNGATMKPPYFSLFGLETAGHTGALAGAGAWS